MKWTIQAACGVNNFNVNSTKDLLQALKILANVNDDSIYAETLDSKNVVQYVAVNDWPPFYIVKRYEWKNGEYDMCGIVHIDAKTGSKISCKGNVIPNIIYEIQKIIRKG